MLTITAQAAAAGPNPLAVWALVISGLAFVAAVNSASFTGRQALAAERANRLDTSARLRVIVRDRRETRDDGFLDELATRWEIQNVGRVAARRVEIAVIVPGIHSDWLNPWKKEISAGGTVVIDGPRNFVLTLAQVTLAKAERGLDAVYADAEWRDDREGRQTRRIEIEQLGSVHPQRAEGETPPL